MHTKKYMLPAFAAMAVVSFFAATANTKAAYSITTLGTAVTENFNSYNGSSVPNANWTIAPGLYRGNDAGTCNQGGVRSYGGGTNSADRALGFLGNGSTQSYTASAAFSNDTGGTITSLVIAYKGEQWFAQASAASNITVAYSINGGSFTNLTDLTFNAPSVAAGGAVDGNSATYSSNKSTTINSLNINAGDTITIRWTYTGNTGGSRQGLAVDDISVTGNGVPSGPNTSVITATPPNVAFGRVIKNQSTSQNVALGKTGTGDATYTLGTSGAATTTSGAGTVTTTGTSINVGLNTSTTGVQSGTVTATNTATTLSGTTTNIGVSGTVVDNRTITATGVNVGNVLVGFSTTTTLSTTGDDNNNTRVTVTGSSVTSNGVTIAGSGSTVFNDASDTKDLSVTFGTSGSKNTNIALTGGNGALKGEGLTGENVKDVNVNVQAQVYQSGQVLVYENSNSANVIQVTAQTTGTQAVNSTPIEAGSSDAIQIENSGPTDGGQSADIKVAANGLKVSTGFSLEADDLGNPLLAGSTVLGTGEIASGKVAFNSTGKLNGTHVGTVVVTLENGLKSGQSIAGTSAGDLGTYVWKVASTVSGNTGGGTAHVLSGGSFANYNTTNDAGLGTKVELLGGQASVDRDLSISFDSTAPTAFTAAGNDAFRVSDVVNLNGSGSDLIVLQLTYDEASLGSLAESDVRLAWFNGSNWVLAINGNSDGGASGQFFAGAYAGQGLGAYGLDVASNTVWAVIDHNSEFAALAAPVPEPGTLGLLMGAGAVLLAARRRRSNR